MLVSDLMKTDVITVVPETTLADAARIMLAQHLSGLPVLKDGRVTGVITEGDLLRRVELGTEGSPKSRWMAFLLPDRLADDYVHTHGLHVRDVMASPAVVVAPDDSLADAAALMTKRHIKRLPVVSDGGDLVGVIGRTDMLHVLARRLIEAWDPLSERDIHDHIMNTLAGQRWAPKAGVRVKVAGGKVTLLGPIFSEAEHRAVRVIAESTPGVTSVVDGLVFVDPGSGMAIPCGG